MGLELGKLYLLASLVIRFLLRSANGRRCRKPEGGRGREEIALGVPVSFIFPSSNSRRLAPAPASFGPSSTFLAWVIASSFSPSLFLDIYLELDDMFQRTGAKSVPEGNNWYAKQTNKQNTPKQQQQQNPARFC